jgi:hypothetical protein
VVAAGHSRHADVFVTADRRYAAALERVREWAPVDFAHVRRIPGTGSAVSGVANGAAQESNLPSRGLHDLTGFEDFQRNGLFAGKTLFADSLRASPRAGPVRTSLAGAY